MLWLLLEASKFPSVFLERSTPSELSYVLLRALADLNAPPADEESWLRQAISRAKLRSGVLPELDDQTLAILSSAVEAEYGLKIGQRLCPNNSSEYPEASITGFPRRQLLCPSFLLHPYFRDDQNLRQDLSINTPRSEPQEWLDTARPAKDVLDMMKS